MPYDPHKHHRQSIRLKGYDYTLAGAYFVTICTHKRLPLFGKIVEDKMRLSLLGQLVYREWQKTAVVRPNVYLDAFVVMPNHLHGILVIFLNEATLVRATRRAKFRRGNPPLTVHISDPVPLIYSVLIDGIVNRFNSSPSIVEATNCRASASKRTLTICSQ